MKGKNPKTIEEFIGITSCKKDVAEKFLSRAGWDLGNALNAFLDNPQENKGG
jgi:hypothetical protein